MNFFKIITSSVFFLFFSSNINAQESKNQIDGKKTFYCELLGSSGTSFSINYDKAFKVYDNSYLDYTIGFGCFPTKQNFTYWSIPVSVNLTNGINNNHFEFGLGLTYHNGTIESGDYVNEGSVTVIKPEVIKTLFGSIRIGYKYQKPSGGFFLRIGLAPMIRIMTISNNTSNYKNAITGGIGIGYTL